MAGNSLSPMGIGEGKSNPGFRQERANSPGGTSPCSTAERAECPIPPTASVVGLLGEFQMNSFIVDGKSKEKFDLEDVLNKVIHGDCIDVMKRLPSEIVDMVFIDPPYFLQLPRKTLLRWKVKTVVEGVNDAWDKFTSFKEYDDFLINVLTEVKRIMKPNATIWCIGTYHNIFRIGKIMQDLGYWILNDIVWLKSNPMPNWLNVRFTNATENLIWAVKDKNVKKYSFNKEYAKKFASELGYNTGINVWKIPLCIGRERMKDEKGIKLHSTQKPEALMERVILTSTKEGDIVFDPVAGTGTTGFVAKKLRRHFIMIEINDRYIKAIQKRFSENLGALWVSVAPRREL
jgi:DNA modification methylase